MDLNSWVLFSLPQEARQPYSIDHPAKSHIIHGHSNVPFTLTLSLSDSKVTVYTHTHTHTLTLAIPCTCCHDVINRIQGLKIYSHADSLSLSLQVMRKDMEKMINQIECTSVLEELPSVLDLTKRGLLRSSQYRDANHALTMLHRGVLGQQ